MKICLKNRSWEATFIPPVQSFTLVFLLRPLALTSLMQWQKLERALALHLHSQGRCPLAPACLPAYVTAAPAAVAVLTHSASVLS